ncbi:DnaJ domain-containing protein [Campylobacter lari]|uniref:TerB family tellurite resistance protein n=1 Tax=Campylobacter lari TaxID=201 RepID=UPI0011EB0B86|nr:TerB family tellurite resistance protein [Campylobacter lari]EAH7585934.1 molecular chaperone DjiA [Campylobacter lari]EAI5559946.1 molecular chaperone DjiA [Campylobacter lari]EAJ5701325.1 molecular chaperone DjiA [Campylobacter lari]EAK2602881.1 molecular chaperone DjiA [Campylobacter lari]EAK5530172.1 molecular chaperone DjiA [Campylobacter lari]
MLFVLLVLAILAFYWYYKTWGKDDLLGSFKKGAKSFSQGFKQGYHEERIDGFKRRLNYYVIALLAKIAKSDGRVSENEANMISQILDYNAKDSREREFLKQSFNEHKNTLNDTYEVAKELIKEVPLPQQERINILNVLVAMALIDGELNNTKKDVLKAIVKAFNLDVNILERLLNSMQTQKVGMNLQKACEILGVSENVNLQELKKRYRELAKKYHPDILNANNSDEAKIKEGVKKFQEVNESYEFLKQYIERKNQ